MIWGYQYDGGNNTIQGKDIAGNEIEGPIEIFLDFDYFFSSVDYGKVFLVSENIGTIPGEIEYFALVDYRWNGVFELPYSQSNFPIGDPLAAGINYDLIPHETNITSNLTFDSDMVSRFNPTVVNEATLTVEDGVQIDMYESEIHINEGSSLVLEDNVTFLAKKGICKLVIDGNVSIGSNVSFIAEEDAQLQIKINYTSLNLVINNAHFQRAAIISYIDELTISNSIFTDGGIHGFYGDFDISNTEFISSFVNILNADTENRTVSITGNCNFSGFQSAPAIHIQNYPNFKIDECSITERSNAINLFNCGFGRNYQQISNCEITGNNQSGITVYRSSVDILNNQISNNISGIKCFNRSEVHIAGDKSEITQEIKDNEIYEVYASAGSFPHYFHWNLIQDDDNLPGDPLIYYSGTEDEELDVINNCWGEEGCFNPNDDLFPSENYIWDPVWKCMDGSGSGEGSDAEGMYLAARDKIEAEDFAGAKADFREIVVQYPTSKYAQASLKELYSLEAFVSNDYTGLKTYYNSEPNIQSNPELEKLSEFLVNFCEIKLENWPTAIAWFENVIQNPKSMEDSIFAIIDLGYTYFLIENGGLKTAYTGNMIEHKPVSVKQFEEKRDHLLSLLPGDQLGETMKGNIASLKEGALLQNVPNPFKGTTQIWYKLKDESSVTVNVFDYTGKRIKSYSEGTMAKGAHFFEFSSDGLPAGIYFYSLEVNGKVTDSKKMTVMR